MIAHERALGQRFLDGLPDGVDLYGLPTMEGRVPTFCFNVPGRTSEEVATHLADEHEVAVWWGNYYALETMRRLGLDEWMGAVRAGFVHYNTEDEVDRLLAGVAGAPVKILVLGGTQFVGRALVEAALAAGDELTLFHRGRTNPGLFPEVEHVLGDRDGGLGALDGRTWDACIDVSGYLPRLVGDSATALRDERRALRLRLDDLGLRRPRRAARRERPARDARGRDDRGDRRRYLRRPEGPLRAARDRHVRPTRHDRAARVRHRPVRPHRALPLVGPSRRARAAR